MKVILEHFERILDLFDDGIYISDKQGYSLKVNKMYEQLTGLTQEKIIGKHVSSFLKEGIFDTVLNPVVVRTKQPATTLQTINNFKKVMLRGYPIFDAAGEVCLVVTFVRDMTMMIQFQEQIAQQKKIIESYEERFEVVMQEPARHGKEHVFESSAMKNLVTLIERIATTDATVLFLGETGVGKDYLARMCHEHSLRSKKMFLKVDCSSITSSLIESELFGYMPGAFSGATSKGKPGYFEIADKGSIFLDEIGELPLPMQTRLLRVLQDGEVMRIGAASPQKIDVRIIAATNRNLEEEVAEGRFRRDLYYRLNVVELRVPSLWERREDIVPLVNFFLERFRQKYKKNMHFTSEALAALQDYHWHGNVRELQNVVQNLVITKDSSLLTLQDMPTRIINDLADNADYPPVQVAPQSLKEIVAVFEREILQKALHTYGSVNKVAEVYKVDRTTIFRKLKAVATGGKKAAVS